MLHKMMYKVVTITATGERGIVIDIDDSNDDDVEEKWPERTIDYKISIVGPGAEEVRWVASSEVTL